MLPTDMSRQDDEIKDWIAGLRARLAHGDLADIGPIDLGYGTRVMPAALTIQIMLADLDGCDDPVDRPDERRRDLARRASLLDDFRRLRMAIG